MNLLIINGPNLSTIGTREPEYYGKQSFEKAFAEWQNNYPECNLSYFQSDEESAIIKALKESATKQEGVILNGGAYTHTSIALSDAVRSLNIPVIEVHISNIFAREQYRRQSYLSAVCRGSISGLGLDVYRLAIEALLHLKNAQNN